MVLTGADLAGVALIAAATLAGAWLGRRFARLRTISLACAAVALIAVVAADLVPDIWHDLRETGLPWWIAVAGLAAGLAVTDVAVRRGCTCRRGVEVPAGGRATAVALGVHRALEGAALAIAGSAAVIAALVAHAGSEGFALTALLRGERKARAAVLLGITCVSPAAGAAVLALVHLPESVAPALTSVVAGVLLRAALAAWQVRPRPARADTDDESGLARRFRQNRLSGLNGQVI
jgi:ZIP family zinc transporter